MQKIPLPCRAAHSCPDWKERPPITTRMPYFDIIARRRTTAKYRPISLKRGVRERERSAPVSDVGVANQLKRVDSHCMSSLTEVETGTEMLLLAAWQVKMLCRSLLCRSLTTSSLLTFKNVTNKSE